MEEEAVSERMARPPVILPRLSRAARERVCKGFEKGLEEE